MVGEDDKKSPPHSPKKNTRGKGDGRGGSGKDEFVWVVRGVSNLVNWPMFTKSNYTE
jgi:hypothetical protein